MTSRLGGQVSGGGPFTPSVSTIALPSTSKAPGATYLAVLDRESRYPLDDLPVGYRIDGMRLPDLARSLCLMPPDTSDSCLHTHLRCLPALMFAGVEPADPVEAALLRAARENPEEMASWAAWSDWRQEKGSEPPGISLLRQAFTRMARFPGRLQDRMPRTADLDAACRMLTELEKTHRAELRTQPQSRLHVEEHLAQMCLDVSYDEEPYFTQWIFFDDLWASAHRDLANAILRFAARWDVLSADKR